MTISKQKLLQWIDKKRYVYTIEDYDHATVEGEKETQQYIGRLNMLSLLVMAVESGEFDYEQSNEERTHGVLCGDWEGKGDSANEN